MVAKTVFSSLVIGAAMVGGGAACAAVRVESTAEPLPFLGETLGLRLREFESTVRNGNDQELYLGRGDLGKAANRVGADTRYVLGDNSFSLALQGGTLTAMLNRTTLAIRDVFSQPGIAARQPFDTLRIGITDRAKGDGLIALDNLLLSGTDWSGRRIDNARIGSLGGIDSGGTSMWDVTGLDFRQNFTLLGTLSLMGAGGRFSNSAELNRVDFTLGDAPTAQAAVPDVSTWVMMITGFAFVGTALRGGRRTAAAAG